MTEFDKIVAAFVEARRAERKLKRAVAEWFEHEALEGNLVHAYQAPMWSDYEAAADRYSDALVKLDGAIERQGETR